MKFAVIMAITGFLRTFLVVLLIWYGIKLVTRYILPFMVNKTMKNVQSRMQEQMREQERNSRMEGEVTVEGKSGHREKKSTEGEYVDFEEVD